MENLRVTIALGLTERYGTLASRVASWLRRLLKINSGSSLFPLEIALAIWFCISRAI